MHCLRCGVCCTETEMLLSQEDINRIEKRGYKKDFFAQLDNEGYAMLRNENGFCVFYNPKNHTCKIYRYRPAGCRLYPVIFVEGKGIAIDKICKMHHIDMKEKERRGTKIRQLLKTIDAEAEQRRVK